METLLADIDGCVVYIDDIIITGRTDEEPKKTLERVLQCLQEAGMRVNPEKLQLMQDNITSLGHVFSSEGVSPCPEKIKAMVDAKPPTSVGELQSFIGCQLRVEVHSRFSQLAVTPVHIVQERCCLAVD